MTEEEKKDRRDSYYLSALENINYSSPEILKNCPVYLLDERICIEAVTRCPTALEHVPEGLRSDKVCEAAIQNLFPFDDEGFFIVHFMPSHIIENHLPKLLNFFTSEVLSCIKPENLTPNIIKFAIVTDDEAFFSISPDKRTAEYCLLQAKTYPSYFKYYPDLVPEQVQNTHNVYTLDKYIKETTKEDLYFEQIIDLFEGKRIERANKSLEYNPKTQTLKVIEHEKKEDEKNKIPPKRKGLRR